MTRLLIVDTYYDQFLKSAYANDPSLSSSPYSDQWRTLMDWCFGTADFYSSSLASLDIEASEVVANASPLQIQWAKENEPSLVPKAPTRALLARRWQMRILQAQVERTDPDIVFVQNADWVDDSFLAGVKRSGRFLVTQHATVLGDPSRFRHYDLVLSAVPRIVDQIRAAGKDAEQLRLGFGAQVLDRLDPPDIIHDVVHVGSYGKLHRERNHVLEVVARRVPTKFWGPGVEYTDPSSPIRAAYQGQAWGLDMYRVRATGRVTITKHITEVVGDSVGNCTMYEATGIGTCLMVDQRGNLGDLFEAGREVIAYSSPQDAAEKAAYLLENEHERRRVAAAGQARTLRDHTYVNRMSELVEILEPRLRRFKTGPRRR